MPDLTTFQGEKNLGAIATRVYGPLRGAELERATAALLEANPHLGALRKVPPGTVIVVPPVAGTPRDPGARDTNPREPRPLDPTGGGTGSTGGAGGAGGPNDPDTGEPARRDPLAFREVNAVERPAAASVRLAADALADYGRRLAAAAEADEGEAETELKQLGSREMKALLDEFPDAREHAERVGEALKRRAVEARAVRELVGTDFEALRGDLAALLGTLG